NAIIYSCKELVLQHETGSAHSRLLEDGWPCHQASRDCGVSAQLSRPLAQANFAPPDKFLVTDLITKHDVAVNKELAGRCHFCLGAAFPTANLGIELSDLFISAGLGGLSQQMPNKP